MILAVVGLLASSLSALLSVRAIQPSNHGIQPKKDVVWQRMRVGREEEEREYVHNYNATGLIGPVKMSWWAGCDPGSFGGFSSSSQFLLLKKSSLAQKTLGLNFFVCN